MGVAFQVNKVEQVCVWGGGGFPRSRGIGLGAERETGAVWAVHVTYHMGTHSVDRQTETIENITFPQAKYTSGNETCVSA